MKHTKRLLAFLLALIVMAGIVGCAKNVDNTPPTEEPTTQPVTQPTDPTKPAPVVPTEKEVNHLHKGLYIPLGESVSTTAQDNQLSFESKSLRGGVTFKKLSDLPENSAKTSESYAKQLLSVIKEENPNAWVGTSTGVGYYVVTPSAEKTEVRAMYIWGHVCWEVWAESSDSALESQLIRIVGRCYVQEGKIPQTEG